MLKGVSPSHTKHRSPNTTGSTKAQKPLYTMDSKAQFFHGTLRFELSSVALENEAWLNTARYKKISLVYLDAHVALGNYFSSSQNFGMETLKPLAGVETLLPLEFEASWPYCCSRSRELVGPRPLAWHPQKRYATKIKKGPKSEGAIIVSRKKFDTIMAPSLFEIRPCICNKSKLTW